MMQMEIAQQPKRFLIVEDDSCLYHSVQRVVRQLSRQSECKFVTNVQDAIDLMQTEKFDLILCDYTLCGFEDGLDFWKHCKRQFFRTPFVMMSGISVPQYLSLTKDEQSAPPFLPKPFSTIELKELIRSYL